MNELTVCNPDLPLAELGRVLSSSGFFADARDANQAIVKVLAGRELGIPPVASMTGIHVIKGRPSLSANLMAACIKRSGHYTYEVLEHDDTKCSIQFYEGVGAERRKLGPPSVFTASDAKRAGTQNMGRFPKNMLFARALSNGARWHCPDIFGGPCYTHEELGATVDEDGYVVEHVVEVEAVEHEPDPAPDPTPVAAPGAGATTPAAPKAAGKKKTPPTKPAAEPSDNGRATDEQVQEIKTLVGRAMHLGFTREEFVDAWLPTYGVSRAAELSGIQAADVTLKLGLEIQTRQVESRPN